MASMNTLVQSSESKETVLQFYGPQFYRYMDMVGRNDFYGWSGDGPVRSLAEKMGLSRDSHATTEEYASILQAAGFGHIQYLDTTALATQAVLRAIYRHVTQREQIIAALDERYYLGALEVWAEFLAHMSEGQLQHCGFVAVKQAVT